MKQDSRVSDTGVDLNEEKNNENVWKIMRSLVRLTVVGFVVFFFIRRIECIFHTTWTAITKTLFLLLSLWPFLLVRCAIRILFYVIPLKNDSHMYRVCVCTESEANV